MNKNFNQSGRTIITSFVFCFLLIGLPLSAQELTGITLYNHEGNGQTSLADHKGKPLIVNFWAPWCIPCLTEFPEIDALYRSYQGQIELLAVTAEEKASLRNKFLNKINPAVSFPIFYDKGGTLHNAMPVTGMPFTAVFDKSGALRGTFTGFTRAEGLTHLKQIINSLLKE